MPSSSLVSQDPPAADWRPLLSGDLAEQALAAVDHIAADLRRAAVSSAPPEPLPLNRMRFSLSGGLAGQALFFAYLDHARPGEGHDETAVELLEKAFDDLGETEAAPGLCSGFTGVAWTVEHLRGRLFDVDGEDAGAEIAATHARLLDCTPWPLEFDLISGLVGHGIYALERMPRPLGRECLEFTLARLAESAERGPRGAAWWTPPRLMTGHKRDEAPEGLYDLGIAHGNPGVIALLGEACSRGVAVEVAQPLLAEAVAWLLEQQNPPGSGSRFPRWIAPGDEAGETRVAWCYGDLGIAAALLGAARGAGEPDWERTARGLARGAAARSFESAGAIDAGLCHGAAGNAHLFNRLFQATGDPLLGEAARAWAERALSMRCPGEGIGGFLSWVPNARLERGWQSDPGFLTGAAGIGLALLAAATPIEPAWDRALLVSVPPRIVIRSS